MTSEAGRRDSSVEKDVCQCLTNASCFSVKTEGCGRGVVGCDPMAGLLDRSAVSSGIGALVSDPGAGLLGCSAVSSGTGVVDADISNVI